MAGSAQLTGDTGALVGDALMRLVHTGLADPPAPVLNTNGIVDFIATKIAPILLAILGVVFISRAGRGEMSKMLTSSAIAIIGLAFIAGGAVWFLFGKRLVDLIFG